METGGTESTHGLQAGDDIRARTRRPLRTSCGSQRCVGCAGTGVHSARPATEGGLEGGNLFASFWDIASWSQLGPPPSLCHIFENMHITVELLIRLLVALASRQLKTQKCWANYHSAEN